jgi:hypothetical protein
MKRLFSLLIALLIVFSLESLDNKHVFRTGDQSLFFMPTAYTMPKLDISLTSYNFSTFQLEVNITHRTQIGISSNIPGSYHNLDGVYTLGIKSNFLRWKAFDDAIFATYSPTKNLRTIGNVISYRESGFSGHTALMYLIEDENYALSYNYFGITFCKSFFAMFGIMKDLSEISSFYVEFLTQQIFNRYEEMSYFINVGAKFRTNHFSLDLCLICPFENEKGIHGLKINPSMKVSSRF